MTRTDQFLRGDSGRVASIALLILATSLVSAAAQDATRDTKKEREPIGKAMGKTIYRDQIGDVKEAELGTRLVQLFAGPAYVKYQADHKKEIEPTEDEIKQAAAYFDQKHRERMKTEEPKLREELKAVAAELEQKELTAEKRRMLMNRRESIEYRLKPPGKPFAMFVLTSWKLQRHLYENYGGGRILWQQAGLEAFDAMHNWLKDCEKKGDFQIDDPKLRKAFYGYWTRSHGAFLTDDKERIRTEFLEPAWAPWTKRSK